MTAAITLVCEKDITVWPSEHEENQELIRAMRDGTTKAAVAHAEVLKEEEQA